MNEMLANIKRLQSIVSKVQTTATDLAQREKTCMDKVNLKIIEVFDVDFIKQVCYENDVEDNEIKIVVIYEHNDFQYAVDIIVNRFVQFKKCFRGMYLELMFFHTTEVKPNRLEDTTTVFKRNM